MFCTDWFFFLGNSYYSWSPRVFLGGVLGAASWRVWGLFSFLFVFLGLTFYGGWHFRVRLSSFIMFLWRALVQGWAAAYAVVKSPAFWADGGPATHIFFGLFVFLLFGTAWLGVW